MSPPTATLPRYPLPSTGSFRSPASSVLRGSWTSQHPSLGLRLSSAVATVLTAVRFVSPPAPAVVLVAWTLVTRPSSPGPIRTEMLGPPRFLPHPLRRAVVYDPGGPDAPHPNGTKDAAFDLCDSLGSHNLRNFGAPYLRPVRSLSTLRSHGCPCTTQDSLPACWLSVGRTGFAPGGFDCPISEMCHLLPWAQALPGAPQIRRANRVGLLHDKHAACFEARRREREAENQPGEDSDPPFARC